MWCKILEGTCDILNILDMGFMLWKIKTRNIMMLMTHTLTYVMF